MGSEESTAAAATAVLTEVVKFQRRMQMEFEDVKKDLVGGSSGGLRGLRVVGALSSCPPREPRFRAVEANMAFKNEN